MYVTPYKRGTKYCDLGLTQKYVIAEISSKCPHGDKYLLKSVKQYCIRPAIETFNFIFKA